jgi:hypothetical protein
MKSKNWMSHSEVAVLTSLLVYIVLRWNVTKVSVGDFFLFGVIGDAFFGTSTIKLKTYEHIQLHFLA